MLVTLDGEERLMATIGSCVAQGMGLIVTAGALLGACSSDEESVTPSANAKAQGSVIGLTLPEGWAIARGTGAEDRVLDSGRHYAEVFLSLYSRAADCGLVDRGADLRSTTRVNLIVSHELKDRHEPIGAGTYPIHADGMPDSSGNVHYVSANIQSVSAECSADGNPNYATAGTITLSEVSSGRVRGTFDLTFGADKLAGTFDSPYCAQPSVTETKCE